MSKLIFQVWVGVFLVPLDWLRQEKRTHLQNGWLKIGASRGQKDFFVMHV
jgi:hypothetical protein